MVGLDKPAILDSGCFELVSSHWQGIRMTCLAHHPALYTHGHVHVCIQTDVRRACLLANLTYGRTVWQSVGILAECEMRGGETR